MTTAAHRPRILVVEDEAIVARDIQVRLQELGYDPVGHAARGEDAVAMARAVRPDLVLMDIQLAGALDGIAAATAIRAERAVPVVYLTAFAEDDVLERAKLTDPFGYIIKPFADRELRTVLEMALYKHQIDATLRESEFRWKFAIEGSGDGLWDWNVPANTVFFSPLWKSILGFADDEIGNGLDEWSSRVHPDELAQVMADVQAHLDGATPAYRNEHRMRCKDGRWKWILDRGVVVARDAGGAVLRVIGTHSEITERRQMEDDLRASEERYQRIVEGLTDYQYTVRVQAGRAVETRQGPACAAVTGYTAGEFAANPDLWLTMVVPEHRARVLERVQLVMEGTECAHLEHQIVRKDGATRWVRDTVIPNWSADGELRSYDGVIEDITELKQAEAARDELESRNAHIEKAESLGRMAGAIAHIFNNQLQVVVGNLELAMSDSSQRPGTMESLTDAMQAANKAAEVSAMLVTYLAQTHGNQVPLDLSAACQPAVSRLIAGLPPGVALETELGAPGLSVRGSSDQLDRVLNNLLANAREAVGEGPGTLRLTLRMAPAADIPANHRFPVEWLPRDTAYACLEVADTGCGIVDEDIDRLFDPFFTTKFTGRGLGLPVVLGVVREHNGAVVVESEPGRGSVFRVYLPVTAEEVPTAPLRVAATPGTAASATVLVVEPEHSLRRVATVALERAGFTVYAAQDGTEAVELFSGHRDEIGCVLCALRMPRLDGWSTLEALRQLKPGIRFILTSGHNEAQEMAGRHLELPHAYLSKPYSFDAMVAALRHVPSSAAP